MNGPTTTPSLSVLAKSLAGTFPGSDDAPLARALLRRLAYGEPVSASALAAAAECDQREVSSALARWPNVQRDEHGRVVAFSGLSVLPTAHRFFVRGRQLYTWCAWDTLFLPALLDQEARVESTCPVTGAEVRLTVGPERVIASQPDEVWVSFPPPAQTSTVNITESFCCHVHFLAGPEPAARWLTGRDGAMALALEDAFVLGRLATRAFATPDPDGGR